MDNEERQNVVDRYRGRRTTYHMLMGSKKDIIQKYNNGMKVLGIAKVYGVAVSTMYIKLKQWEEELKRPKSISI